MNINELKQRITLDMLIEASSNTEAFEKSYERSIERIFEDIKAYIKSASDGLSDEIKVMNDIDDCVAINEEKAYIIGFCDGIRIINK